MSVSGDVIFPQDASFSGATVTVSLVDSGMADSSAGAVAQQVIRGYSHRPGDPPLHFELKPSSKPDERAFLAVTVHVSLSGGDDIEQGDYMTMQSYPVLNHGYPDLVKVEVRQV